MRHVLGIDKHHRDLEPSKALKELLLTEMAEEEETAQEIILSHPEMRQVRCDILAWCSPEGLRSL
jgi:hypothetical protein